MDEKLKEMLEKLVEYGDNEKYNYQIFEVAMNNVFDTDSIEHAIIYEVIVALLEEYSFAGNISSIPPKEIIEYMKKMVLELDTIFQK